MGVNELRSIVTVVFFLTFLGIMAWAYSKKNRQVFEEAAAVPFMDEGADAIKIGDARE